MFFPGKMPGNFQAQNLEDMQSL